MTENISKHYQALIIGLLIFGLTLPLSKSVSSIIMGLIYVYSFAIVFYYKDFRTTVTRNIKQPLNIPISVYIFTVLLGLLFSEDLSEGISVIKRVSNLLLVYLMVSVLINAEQDEEKRFKNAEYVLLFFVAGIFILDLLGLSTYFGFIDNKRYALPLKPLDMHHIWFGNLNAIGLYAAVSLLLFSPYNKPFPRWIFIWFFIILGIISVLLSTSRTAWLGIIFTVIVFSYFLIKNKRTFFIAAGSIVVGCIILYLFNDIVHTRIDQVFSDFSLLFSGVTSTSIGARLMMWKAALGMFFLNPIFGVGTGDYRSTIYEFVASGRSPDFILWYTQPHNMYLFTLATNGLIGLSALLFVFYRIIKLTKKLIKPLQRERLFGFISLCVAVHFMIAGLTESLMNIHILICTFAFIMGISMRKSCIKEGKV